MTPIVQKLVDYYTENPTFKTAFEESFGLAYATGLKEFKEYKIHNVDDYIRHLNEYVNWTPSENRTGTNVYNHLCLLHFVLDMPPVRDQQNPIDPSSKPPYRWLSEWLVEYAKELGKWMNTPASINPETLATFYTAPAYHMQDYDVPDGGWKTFNEFFARHIKASVRPIASPNDDTVVVSPADCTFDGKWPVNDDAIVNTFDVKGVPWHISQLLNDDAECAKLFAGGAFILVFGSR